MNGSGIQPHYSREYYINDHFSKIALTTFNRNALKNLQQAFLSVKNIFFTDILVLLKLYGLEKCEIIRES